jgi:hypothetical protein
MGLFHEMNNITFVYTLMIFTTVFFSRVVEKFNANLFLSSVVSPKNLEKFQ